MQPRERDLGWSKKGQKIITRILTKDKYGLLEVNYRLLHKGTSGTKRVNESKIVRTEVQTIKNEVRKLPRK